MAVAVPGASTMNLYRRGGRHAAQFVETIKEGKK